MTKTELRELIANGRGSGVELKKRTLGNQEFAKEIVAFANFRGGRVLLGVDDNGRVCGLPRSDTPAWTEDEEAGPRTYQRLQDWVTQVCRDSIRPSIVPYFDVFHDLEPCRDVAVVEVERGWNVHHVWHRHHCTCHLRVGTSNREASPEKLTRGFPQRGAFRPELRPVSGTSIADLDRRRLTDYLKRVRGQDTPGSEPSDAWREDMEASARSEDERRWRLLVESRKREWYEAREADWTSLLVNTGFLYDSDRRPATVAGLMLFGKTAIRFLPHAKVDAIAYSGSEKDCAPRERRTLHGPIVPLKGADGTLLEPGLIEQAVEFFGKNTGTPASEYSARRRERRDCPEETVREAVVNAVVHRDYLLSESAIELSIYSDRLEVVSPGRLANGMTLAKVRSGCRRARNELLRDVMRDYECPRHVGLGVPSMIIRGIKEHNGTDSEILEEDGRFIVRLCKDAYS